MKRCAVRPTAPRGDAELFETELETYKCVICEVCGTVVCLCSVVDCCEDVECEMKIAKVEGRKCMELWRKLQSDSESEPCISSRPQLQRDLFTAHILLPRTFFCTDFEIVRETGLS